MARLALINEAGIDQRGRGLKMVPAGLRGRTLTGKETHPPMFVLTIVLSVLLAVVFFGTGARKVPGSPAIADEAQHHRLSLRNYRIIGVLELAASAGLLIGLAWAPLGIAAGAGLVLLMAGAAVSHQRAGDPVMRVAAPAVLGILAAIAVVLRALTA
jgi:hypothetical protein